MRVYREGDRIRNENTTRGYHDCVPDAVILDHLRDATSADMEFRQFAYAVLGLRMHERDLAERGVTRPA